MPIEIELKVKVDSHDPVRARLRECGAQPHGRVTETNTLFDDTQNTLYHGDRGLRVRESRDETSAISALLTYKGPRVAGAVKSRVEINLDVASASAAQALLEALGYRPVIRFQKRRESWDLGGCHVELDEIPHLGTFVEIEGPNEPAIIAVRKCLGLDAAPGIPETYIALLAEHCRGHGLDCSDIRFS